MGRIMIGSDIDIHPWPATDAETPTDAVALTCIRAEDYAEDEHDQRKIMGEMVRVWAWDEDDPVASMVEAQKFVAGPDAHVYEPNSLEERACLECANGWTVTPADYIIMHDADDWQGCCCCCMFQGTRHDCRRPELVRSLCEGREDA